MNKLFLYGFGVGFVSGFIVSIVSLDRFYRSLMSKVIDEIHSCYKKGICADEENKKC